MEAAFFDLDKTVIAKASLVAFGRPLYDAGMISRWVIMRALWSNLVFHYLGAGDERMQKFRQSALRITRGWDQALVSAIVRDTLVEVIEPIVYAEALDLIHEHRAAGRRVYLISASPEEIVAPLAQFLGVDEAIASRAELDGEGRYTGNVEFFSYGPYKAEAIRHAAERTGIDLASSYAYSDSVTDVPMLETVGHPVAVNPDRDLARLARERGWETRWFEHGVPLRERVNMPRPNRTVTVGVAAVVVATTATGVWWWVAARRRVAPPLPPAPARPWWSRLDPGVVGGAARRWASLRAAGRGNGTAPRTAPSRNRFDGVMPAYRWRMRPAEAITRSATSSRQTRRGRAGRRSR